LTGKSPDELLSHKFLRNPACAMKHIFEKLEVPEIPSAGKIREIQEVPSSHEVVDHVIRQAEELRKTWSKTNAVGARSSALSLARKRVIHLALEHY
jgi:hypothetical protein